MWPSYLSTVAEWFETQYTEGILILQGVYLIGYCICWVVLFLGCWIYCIASYGFLLGVGLGWLPSAITATVVSLLWPLIAIALLVLVWVLLFN
jgi:hypothetical protein